MAVGQKWAPVCGLCWIRARMWFARFIYKSHELSNIITWSFWQMSNGSNWAQAWERLGATDRNTVWRIETCAYLIFFFPLSRKFSILADLSPMGVLSISCFFTIWTIHLKRLFLTAQWCVFNKVTPDAWHWHCHGFGWWRMRSPFSFQHSRDTGHEWERKLSGCLLHTSSDTIDRCSLHLRGY